MNEQFPGYHSSCVRTLGIHLLSPVSVLPILIMISSVTQIPPMLVQIDKNAFLRAVLAYQASDLRFKIGSVWPASESAAPRLPQSVPAKPQ